MRSLSPPNIRRRKSSSVRTSRMDRRRRLLMEPLEDRRLLAVAVADSTSAGGGFGNGYSLAFDVPAGADRLLTVQTAVDAEEVTAVTYNGSSLTLSASQVEGTGSNAKIWTLPLGTGALISSSIVITTGGASGLGTVSAIALTGVNQTVPIDTSDATTVSTGAAASTVTVASEPGDLVVDAITVTSNVAFPSLTPLSGQTSVAGGGGGAGGFFTAGAASWKPGASPTETVGWTISGNLPTEPGAHVAVNVNQIQPPEINLQGNGVTISNGDVTPSPADHTDFGSADIATDTVTRTFTVQNLNGPGDDPLNLTGAPLVQLSGPGAGAFTVTSAPSTPVAANGGTTTFQVQFDPSTIGTQSATVTIANDDPDEDPYTFAIQGTGTADATVDLSSGVVTVSGGSINNGLTIDVSGGNLRIAESNGSLGAGAGATQVDDNTVTIPLGSISSIVVDGEDGDDTLTIDYSGGDPIPAGGLAFNGGNQGANGDELVVTGGSAGIITHNSSNPSDGSIVIDGSTITYTGLEPITDNMDAANREFTFTWAMAETITLDAGGALDNRIDSSQGEMVDFTNPTDSLTINVEVMGGAGADTINIEGLDAAFDADLIVNGGSDDDVNFQTNPTSIGSGALTVTGNMLAVSQNVSAEGVSLTAQNEVSISGGSTLDGGGSDVSVLANQDNSGSEGFSQDAGSAITTTSNSTSAVTIGVAGTGPAALGALSAGTTSGRVTVIAGGAITDNNGGSTNITADDAVLTAGGAIGAFGTPLDLAVATVSATASGDVVLEDVDDLSVTNISATGGSASVEALSGDLNVGTISATFNVVLEALLGSITDTNGTGTNNVSSTTVEATALSGIDLDVESSVAGGGMVTTAAGDILVRRPTGNFFITGGGITTADGNIVAEAPSGFITLDSSISGGGVNTVTLDASTDVSMLAGATIASGGGVDIVAGGNITVRDITAAGNTAAGGTAAIKLSTTSGNVNVEGPLDATAAADLNIDIDPVDVNVNADMTATGDIDIVADNDVTVAAGVTIEADSDNSGAGDLTIEADADDNVDDGTGGTLLANAVSNLLGADVDLSGDVVTVDNVTGKSNDAAITADVDATLTGSASAADDVLVTALLGNVVIAASASATAGDDIELDADGTVTVGGPLLADEDVEIQTNFLGQGSVFIDADITADGNVIMLPDELNSDVLIGSGAVITSDADLSGAEDIEIFANRDVIQSSGSLVSNTGAIAILTLSGDASIVSAVSNGANQIAAAAAANAAGDVAIQIWPGGTATVDGVVATAGDMEVVSDFDDVILGSVDAGANVAFLEATTGAIIDNNGAAINVTAGALSLAAVDGIGSGDALEADLQTLAASNASNGNIEIDDVGANANLLTIGTVGTSVGVTNGAAGGTVVIRNASPLTVAADVSSVGDVTLTAGDTAAAGDDLTVNAGVTVESTGGNITLNAGDDADIDGDLLASSGTVTINVDPSTGDPDAVGGTVDIDTASIVTTSGGTFLNGGDDNDTFNFAPRVTTSFNVNGNAPVFGDPGVPPGDTLNLDFSALTNAAILTLGGTAGSGSFSFIPPADLQQGVLFSSIESVNSGGDPFHLVLDMRVAGFEDGMDDLIEAQLDAAGTNLQLLVNGTQHFEGAAADILSLTVIGSDDNDTLQVNETAGGLPSFSGQAPAIDNTGIGGGVSDGAHLNASIQSQLDNDFAPATFSDADVSLHFDGGAGDDGMAIVFTTQHNAYYFSDSEDDANSGNIASASFAAPGAPDLLLSFANLAPISFTGAGGGLLVDATSTPLTSTLTLDDDGTSGDGVSIITGDGGFEDTLFSGFEQLLVRGGTGDDLIDLVALDSATALTDVTLDGDNTTGNDTGNDTLRVRSAPAGVSVTLLGGLGDDAFQLFDAGSTVDNIAGPVALDGEAGDDTLIVVDTGDATGDTVLITETEIEGMTGYGAAPDVAYEGIEQLDVTTSSGDDDITIDMTSGGSDLVDAVISAAAGNDELRLESFITDLATITLNGNAGSDTFNEPTGPADPNPNTNPRGKLEPSLTTEIFVNGESGPAGAGNPTTPPDGDVDTFNLDVTVLQAPVIVDTIAGIATSAGPHQNVNFSGMEELCLDDETRDEVNIDIGELYVRTTEFRERIIYTLWNDGGLKLRIDDLENGIYNTFPEHFGLVNGVQMLERIVTFARDGNDLVSIADHVVDGNNDPIPVEFHGEEGDDYLAGGSGDDILVGGPGNDRVLGGEGNNLLFGDGNVLDADGIPIEDPQTDGNDRLSGRSGNDVIFGGGGNDRLVGGDGDDYLHAGSGDDLAGGGLGDDVLIGADGDDTLSGDDGDDILLGGAGTDEVLGRQGHDVLLGGDDADRVRGEEGDDLIVGGNASGVNDATSDAALRAILADWVASGPAVPAGLGTLQLDGVQDLLIGDQGADAFHFSMLPDLEDEDLVFDFLPGDGDTLLP